MLVLEKSNTKENFYCSNNTYKNLFHTRYKYIHIKMHTTMNIFEESVYFYLEGTIHLLQCFVYYTE